MGGTKKKPISQADRSQSAQDAAQAGPKKPEKKTAKEAKLAQQQAKQQALVAPKMDEKQLVKTLTPLKAITLYGTSRALSVNAAVAGQILRSLESKNVLTKIGGYSGHYIYTLNGASSGSPASG